MKQIKLLIYLPVLIFALQIAYAADLHGRIFDDSTGLPISNASVYISEIQIGTTSDEDGNFDFINLDDGIYTVIVRHIGFDEETENVKLLDNTVLNVTCYMQPVLLTIGDITSNAERQQTKIVDTAAIIHLRSETTLRLTNSVRTIPEALKSIPAVMVQKTAHGQGSPYIRGFTGFRNLFIIDGIRLNNSVFREGPNQYWNTVDVYSVNKLEVLKGPGSVLYGSDAIGGTVLTSAAPANYDKTTGLPSGEMYLRLSEAENSIIQRYEISGSVNKRLNYNGGLSYKEFGDLEGGKYIGNQTKTGYSEIDGDLAISYSINSNSNIKVAFQTVNQDDVWRTHKTVYGISWEGTSVGNETKRAMDQDRDLYYLKYFNNYSTTFSDNFILTFSYHMQKESRLRVKSSGSSENQGLSVYTTGLGLQVGKSVRNSKIVYGFDYYSDEVNSFKNKYNSDGSFNSSALQGPVADDAGYKSLGLYVQGKLEIIPRLEFTIGTRYDNFALVADKIEIPPVGVTPLGGLLQLDEQWSQFTSSIKSVYSMTGSPIVIFAAVSQSFRAPNLSDMTRYDFARSDEVEIPVLDLDPEEYTSVEVGFKTHYSNFYCQTGIYHTRIHSMIVRTPTGQYDDEGNMLVTKKNSGNGYISGVETEISVDFSKDVTCFGNINFLSGEVSTYPSSNESKVSEPVSRLMPLAGSAGVSWALFNRELNLELRVLFAGKADELSTRDKSDTQRIPPGGTPGYCVYNISSMYMIDENLSVSCTIENLENLDYRIHGSGLNEPGRNFILTTQYKF